LTEKVVNHDEEHLQLLAIFHYIVGALAALFSCFALMYVGFGCLILYTPATQGNPPPAFMGWFMIAFGAVFLLSGEAMAACILLAGRFIRRRQRYWFVFVNACVQCLFMPFGTILGVFTVIVLSRGSVKELFGISPTIPAVAPIV
jgi:hypothetical protein